MSKSHSAVLIAVVVATLLPSNPGHVLAAPRPGLRQAQSSTVYAIHDDIPGRSRTPAISNCCFAPQRLGGYGGVWDSEVQITSGVDYLTDANNGKKVLTDCRGWIHVVMSSGGSVYYKRYRPGQGWSNDTNLYAIDDNTYSALALDSNGTRIHLVWQRCHLNGGLRSYSVLYLKCDPTATGNGGWDASPTRLSTDNCDTWYYVGDPGPSVACSPGGQVHVCWWDICVTKPCYAVSYIEFSSGAWQSIAHLDSSSHAGYCKYCPAIAAGRNHDLAIAWSGYDSVGGDSIRHIYCIRRRTGAWQPVEPVDAIESNEDQYNPDVTINPVTGDVHIAWSGFADISYFEVFHNWYCRDSAKWMKIDTISAPGATNSPYEPSVSCTVDGRVGVVWNDLDTSGYCHIKYIERSALGRWAAQEPVSTPGDYDATWPSMNADSAGGLDVIWEAARNGGPHIYLRQRRAPFARDIACTGIVQPDAWASVSHPVFPVLTIGNDGSHDESDIPVCFRIDSSGTCVYAGWDTFPGPLQPEVSAQCTMTTQWTPCGNLLASYGVTAACNLSDDQSRVNDTVKSGCTTCSWFDDLQHDSCNLRANAGWRWGRPADSSARCWGDPLIDTVLRIANDSLWLNRLVANIDTPKIAWGSWYYTYPGHPDAGYRLRYSTDNGQTWPLAHASLPSSRGYDGIVGGDSAYWGQCPGDSWERMLYEIPVAKGEAFSLCWQYEDIFGSFYPGVLIGDIVGLGFVRSTPVAEIKIISPAFHLSIAPNPFHGTTHISYALPQAGNVSAKLYDVTGALVRTLVEGRCAAGAHTAAIDACLLARGVYILKFAAGSYRRTAKLILE